MSLGTKDVNEAKTTTSLNDFSMLGMVGGALMRYIGKMIKLEVSTNKTVDFNEIEPWTWVAFDANCPNAPFAGSGIIFTLGLPSGSKFQIVPQIGSGGKLLFRSYLSSNDLWNPWQQVSATALVVGGG